MSGLLGLLILGGLFGSSFMSDNKKAVDGQYARKAAQIKGKDMYYDGFHNLHWTENNEVLDVIKIGGVTEYIGTKSGTIYKRVKSEAFNEMEKQKKKLEDGIKYCKEHDIEYFPFDFPVDIPRDNPLCTGVEVKTGKKYLCTNYQNKVFELVYLEDKPHLYSGQYGKFKEYDAVHDATQEMYKQYNKSLTNHELNVQPVRDLYSRNEKGIQTRYYTKMYRISKEEYEKRLTEVEEFPWEPYRLQY